MSGSKKKHEERPAEELVDAKAMEKVVRQGEVTTTPKDADKRPKVDPKAALGKPRGWATKKP